LLLKKSQSSSRERAGTFSIAPVLTTAPRFIGGPHGDSESGRWDSQISEPPNPGRSEPK
jgi:hypothetical protein